jgi:hypothetical protein
MNEIVLYVCLLIFLILLVAGSMALTSGKPERRNPGGDRGRSDPRRS